MKDPETIIDEKYIQLTDHIELLLNKIENPDNKDAYAEDDEIVDLSGVKTFDHYTPKVIEYANNALNTHYESGLIYYLRGVAHESLENWRQAKKDFKKSIKYGCDPARAALNSLNEKMKNRKRNR